MFYIFLIAVINLGLGFAAAVYLGRRYHRLAAAGGSTKSTGESVLPETASVGTETTSNETSPPTSSDAAAPVSTDSTDSAKLNENSPADPSGETPEIESKGGDDTGGGENADSGKTAKPDNSEFAADLDAVLA